MYTIWVFGRAKCVLFMEVLLRGSTVHVYVPHPSDNSAQITACFFLPFNEVLHLLIRVTVHSWEELRET